MATKKRDILFEAFSGEFVLVMVDREVKQSMQSQSQIETLEIPVTFQGYLTEMDDDFLYLGLVPATICQAIRKDRIVQVEVGDENEQVMDTLLEAGEIPAKTGKEWQ